MGNKIIIGIIVLVLIIAGVYFLFMRPKYSSQKNNPSANTGQVATNTVSISNFAFDPANITVKKGTTVTWVNNDSVTHTVTSSVFSSPDISPGGKFEFTFNNTGTFDYNCSIHPSMKGVVNVE